MTVWMKWHRTDGYVTGMSIFLVEPAEWNLQFDDMGPALAWLDALNTYGPEIVARVEAGL